MPGVTKRVQSWSTNSKVAVDENSESRDIDFRYSNFVEILQIKMSNQFQIGKNRDVLLGIMGPKTKKKIPAHLAYTEMRQPVRKGYLSHWRTMKT